MVKADIHTNDSRQTCAIGTSKALIKVDMDKELLRVAFSKAEIVVKQSAKTAEIPISRTFDQISCQIPWKTTSSSKRYNKFNLTPILRSYENEKVFDYQLFKKISLTNQNKA